MGVGNSLKGSSMKTYFGSAGLAFFLAIANLPGVSAQESINPMAEALKVISEKPGFYCNLNALTPKERAKHDKLGNKIWEAQTAIKELADGFAFQLSKDKVTVVELAEWITGEDKCCSFFQFEVEVERNRGPLWLKIRGDEGIKKFIRATFPYARFN
jgi:hypothetical protein